MSFQKFFSNLQEAPWYRQFLNPVMDNVNENSQLLDIGTGSGKMLEILSKEKNVVCVGTDTSAEMLKEAEVKLKGTSVKLFLIEEGKVLPLEKKSFDCITICSVLFHLENKKIDVILDDALELLTENGKIVIHTPTGYGNTTKLTRHYFSFKNKTIYVWYKSTKKRAKKWTLENYLLKYTTKNNLKYKNQTVMNGFARIETIQK